MEQAMHQPRCRCSVGLLIVAAWTGILGWNRPVAAVMPDSPEVKTVLDKAFKFLETTGDGRLGGKCLVGLCFVKRGERESHPQVQAAVDACKAFKAANPEGKQVGNEYVYSAGLAVVFLCELDPS